MSRKRQDKKQKQKELARQLGVSTSEAGDHHYLQEKERVTRPELHLVELQSAGGLKGLFGGAAEIVCAVYVIEASRHRLAGAVALGDKRAQLEKISYSRPAHFVVVVAAGKRAGDIAEALTSRGAELRLSGTALSDRALASAAWEAPRAVELDLAPVKVAAAVSVRGVDRTAQTLTFDLGGRRAVIEVKV